MSDSRAIPMIDLVAEHAAIEAELRAAIERVLAGGRFILGPEVERFERAIAAKLGVKHAIGCASCSDALVLALSALGIGRGHEVLTSAFSFVATGEAIARTGAQPVFLDIDPRTYDLGDDLDAIFKRVTKRTKAIIPVHLFGQAMPMRALVHRAHEIGMKVIEDAAQSICARDPDGVIAGTTGDAGVLSFFPTKNLGAIGDGGLLYTNDDALAEDLRARRVHGKKGDRSEVLGMNSRLDALQAAVLSVKLPHLDAYNEARRRNAARYDLIFGTGAPHVRPNAYHVFNQYTVRVRDRAQLLAELERASIASAIYYARPLHREPCFQDCGRSLPNAELASEEVISLPIAPKTSEESIAKVGEIVVRHLRMPASTTSSSVNSNESR